MVQIVSNIITPAVLNAAQIDTTTIADNSITDDKIVNGTIQNASIADYVIEPTKFALPTPVGDKVLTFNSTTGVVEYSTTYAHENTDDLSEGSTNQYFTNTRAVDAVEGEATLTLGNISHNGNWTLSSSNGEITITPQSNGYVWAEGDFYTGAATGFYMDGTTLSSWPVGSTPAITIDRDVNITEELTVDTDILIGDYDLLDNTSYPTTGLKVVKPSTKVKWAGISVIEYGGSYSGELPFTSFHNPTIGGEAHGGTEASPTAVPSGKRALQINGSARYGTGAGETHTIANIVINTNENQTSTNRGGNITFRVTPNGTATTRDMVKLNGSGSTQMDMAFDPNGDFGKTVISSQSTNGIEVNSATTFTDLLTLDPVDYGNLPSSPVRGSIAFLINDGAGTYQNQPIYYEGSQWQYFANGTAVATS